MRIVIFHFNPIEKFPPAMNFIRVLESNLPANVHVVVFTTKGESTTELFQPENRQVSIRRIGLNAIKMSPLLRYANYIRYFLGSLMYCLFSVPDKILYYESLSAPVPALLKKYVFRKMQLFIHYHEYMSEQEYNQTYLNKIFHRLEKKLYPAAEWISHTNPERMQLFLQDIGMTALTNTHIYPNYPPGAWGVRQREGGINLPARLVYVGSFGSMEASYIKETLNWVKEQEGKITLDIYSYNVSGAVSAYINELGCKEIRVLEQVNYYQLPGILKNYDIGLILYKATSINVEYCAPNKLFEYLVCGLDTWYAEPMKGIWSYDSTVGWPKVMRLDFEKLGQYNIEELVYRQPAAARTISFTCEEASRDLLDKLIHE